VPPPDPLRLGDGHGAGEEKERVQRENERKCNCSTMPTTSTSSSHLSLLPPLPTSPTNNRTNHQEAAERVAREARARHWCPRVLPADSADLKLLPRETAVVFLIATAGQGEFPANCRGLWRFLARASLPRGCLSGLGVAVFGFGDSGYPLFNAAARKLFNRLVRGLGASALLPLGLGDDQGSESGGGPDAALDPWLRDLWPALRSTTAPLPEGVPEEAWGGGEGSGTEVERLGPCRFHVEVVERRLEMSSTASPSSSSLLPSREEALEAHAAFHRLDALASGELRAPSGYEESRGIGKEGSERDGDEGEEEEESSSSGPARPLSASVERNQRLTPPSYWQDTRHLSLRVNKKGGKSPFFYGPGDVAAFLPEQCPGSVGRVLSASGLNPKDRVRVSASDSASDSSSSFSASFETTAAALVAGVLELDGAAPRRRLFEVLAAFVDVENENEEEEEEAKTSSAAVSTSLIKERLSHFASSEGRTDLDLYCRSEARTLEEVLCDFPAATEKVPLAWLLSAAPRLRPRRFSIASAPSSASRGELDLTVAVVSYHTPHGRPKVGLASGWLSRLQGKGEDEEIGEENCLPLWVERGALSLPALAAAAARQAKSLNPQNPLSFPPLEAWLSTPLILIGPGTGIAPLRSLLQARRAERERRKKEKEDDDLSATAAAVVAPCSLYFGCRSPDADWYYRSEFEAMAAEGTLERYRTAFSREEEEEEEGEEGEDGKEGGSGKKKKTMKPKRYVTHLLREDASQLWPLLSPSTTDSTLLLPATVVVSGSAKNMPRDVQLVFEEIAAEKGGLGLEGGKAFVRRMVSAGRYFVEAWS